ncbi:TPA: hypothetical protein N0F65_010347 [Lagenidium giganteum]|uniref:Uncharacterized protein n=1 Tax=Lagenidium giganteum TaxID=4803 RepID=A0AAV2Z5Y7_9STRA|nr:TPA: hypothetical protein N0F65_010347 [Lagenidium giganteum]
MIYYSTRDVLQLLVRVHGSALFGNASVVLRALLVALVALAVALLDARFQFLPSDNSEHKGLVLSIANTTCVFVGLLLAFRLNAAFQQWRMGVIDISTFGEAARTLLSSACASLQFPRRADEPKQVTSKIQFLRDLKRYTMVYIGLVFHDCRGKDSPRELRELLTEKESEAFLLTDVQQLGAHTWNRHKNVIGSYNKLRASVVELWLRRTVNRALEKRYISPEQAQQLNVSISAFPQMYTRVFNLSNIPIPFNYAQLLHVCVIALLLLYIVALVPIAGLYAPLWVLLWAWLLFAAEQVAIEIECPFGLEPNAIDLEARVLCIQDELQAVLQAHFLAVGIMENMSSLARTPSLESLLSIGDRAPHEVRRIRSPSGASTVSSASTAYSGAASMPPQSGQGERGQLLQTWPTPTYGSQVSTSSNLEHIEV